MVGRGPCRADGPVGDRDLAAVDLYGGYASRCGRVLTRARRERGGAAGGGRRSAVKGDPRVRRYTLDLIGNDLVRFIDGVIGRPTIVAGLSSGGVTAAWLSAFAKQGQVVGAYYEDPPLFASELHPAVGQGIRQAIGPLFAVMAKYLGDESVKVPVLFTHHFRMTDEKTGALIGASSDIQVERVRELVVAAGQPFEYVSLPKTPHSLHGHDPRLYVDTLVGWAKSLPNDAPA